MQHFHYEETDARGAVLDREDGGLPGLELSIGKRFGPYTGLLQASYLGGTVAYDGRTQGGTPVKTDTREGITNIAALVQRALGTDGTPLVLSAGFGYRAWRRDIQPTNVSSGLVENYRWPYWTIGAGADLIERGKWKGSLAVDVRRPIRPTIEVNASAFDPLTLDLGARYSVTVGFPVEYRLAAGRVIVLEPYWEHFALGKSGFKPLTSNGNPTGLFAQEPDSETSLFGVTARFRFSM